MIQGPGPADRSAGQAGSTSRLGPVASWRLTLAPEDGGTVCRATVFGVCPGHVVEVAELDENPGLPVTVTLPALAEQVRSRLGCGHEPLWVEHWPARALA